VGVGAWTGAILMCVGLVWAARTWGARERARARLQDSAVAASGRPADRIGGLRVWLLRAGYRRREAPVLFGLACAGALVLAALSLALWVGEGIGAALAEGAVFVPGPAGALVALVLEAGPAILFLGLALAPWLRVRAARRARVESIEQDLPLTLELLATLGEAGHGFDAAVERLLASQPRQRDLARELRLYQRDVLGGRPRTEALRRLADRVDVPGVSVLVSALVQAEQVGSSLAGVLRIQAEDLRNHRRERALAQAEALEVKLVFPLVLCFLPGLFVAAAGPAFHQFFQLIDRIVRSGG